MTDTALPWWRVALIGFGWGFVLGGFTVASWLLS